MMWIQIGLYAAAIGIVLRLVVLDRKNRESLDELGQRYGFLERLLEDASRDRDRWKERFETVQAEHQRLATDFGTSERDVQHWKDFGTHMEKLYRLALDDLDRLKAEKADLLGELEQLDMTLKEEAGVLMEVREEVAALRRENLRLLHSDSTL